MKVKLGKRYRDTVSGYVGIAVCRTEWMNGCNRASLQAPVDKEGKLPDIQTFDEVQLEIIAEGVPSKRKASAGPRADRAAIRR